MEPRPDPQHVCPASSRCRHVPFGSAGALPSTRRHGGGRAGCAVSLLGRSSPTKSFVKMHHEQRASHYAGKPQCRRCIVHDTTATCSGSGATRTHLCHGPLLRRGKCCGQNAACLSGLHAPTPDEPWVSEHGSVPHHGSMEGLARIVLTRTDAEPNKHARLRRHAWRPRHVCSRPRNRVVSTGTVALQSH